MVIDLRTYKENKEIVKNLNKVNTFFLQAFPQKTWGWVAITSLLFSQLAMETYLKDEKPRKGFYPAIRNMLLNFQKVLDTNEKQQREKGNNERH